MAGRVVFAVGYLPLYRNAVQRKILGKHIFNVGIYLWYGIYACHLLHQLRQNAVHKRRRIVPAEPLGQLHGLIDGHLVRHILIIVDLKQGQAQDRQLHLSHPLRGPAFGNLIDPRVQVRNELHDASHPGSHILAVKHIQRRAVQHHARTVRRIFLLLRLCKILLKLFPCLPRRIKVGAKQQLKAVLPQFSSGHTMSSWSFLAGRAALPAGKNAAPVF